MEIIKCEKLAGREPFIKHRARKNKMFSIWRIQIKWEVQVHLLQAQKNELNLLVAEAFLTAIF